MGWKEGRGFPDPVDRFSPEPFVEDEDDSSRLALSDNVVKVSRAITAVVLAEETGTEVGADNVEDVMKDSGNSPSTSDEVGSGAWVSDVVACGPEPPVVEVAWKMEAAS